MKKLFTFCVLLVVTGAFAQYPQWLITPTNAIIGNPTNPIFVATFANSNLYGNGGGFSNIPPTTGLAGWPASAIGALQNDGAGNLSWAASGQATNVTDVAAGSGIAVDTNGLLRTVSDAYAKQPAAADLTNITALLSAKVGTNESRSVNLYGLTVAGNLSVTNFAFRDINGDSITVTNDITSILLENSANPWPAVVTLGPTNSSAYVAADGLLLTNITRTGVTGLETGLTYLSNNLGGVAFWFTNGAAANSVSNTYNLKMTGNVVGTGSSNYLADFFTDAFTADSATFTSMTLGTLFTTLTNSLWAGDGNGRLHAVSIGSGITFDGTNISSTGGESFWFTNGAAANSVSNTFAIKMTGNVVGTGSSNYFANFFTDTFTAEDATFTSLTVGNFYTDLTNKIVVTDSSGQLAGLINAPTNSPSTGNIIKATSASTTAWAADDNSGLGGTTNVVTTANYTYLTSPQGYSTYVAGADDAAITIGPDGQQVFHSDISLGWTIVKDPWQTNAYIAFTNNGGVAIKGDVNFVDGFTTPTINVSSALNATTANLTNVTADVIVASEVYPGITNAPFLNSDANGQMQAGAYTPASLTDATNAATTATNALASQLRAANNGFTGSNNFAGNTTFALPILGDGSALTNLTASVGSEYMTTNEIDRVFVKTNSTVTGPTFSVYQPGGAISMTNASSYVIITNNGAITNSGNLQAGSINTPGTLKSGDTFSSVGASVFSGLFRFSGVLSVTLYGNTNNWSPAGIYNTWRITPDAVANITGIGSHIAIGTRIVLMNVGTNAITLKDEDANSTANNRFALSADYVIDPDEAVEIIYDNSSTRWRVIGQ